MSLIRLKSFNEDVSRFSNFFNSNIRIEEDSKIALYSLHMKLSDKIIIVDDTNNTLYFTLTRTAGRQRTVTLTNGKYNRQDFRKELEKQLSWALQFDTDSERGFTFKCQIIRDKLSVGFWNTVAKNIILDNVNQLTSAGKTYTSNKANPSDNLWNAFGISKGVFTDSCGLMEATIRSTTNIIFGLIASSDISNYNTIETEDISFGVYVDGSGIYKYVSKGVIYSIDGNPTANNNDVVQIRIEAGKRMIYIQGTKKAEVQEDSLTYKYHPCISFRGNNSKIKLGEYNYLPQFEEDLKDETIVENANDENLGVNPMWVKLSFTEGSKKLLGFETSKVEKKEVKGTFTSDVTINKAQISSSFVVEAENIPLQGFDGNTRNRRNILSVIPVDYDDATKEIIWTPPEPLFLDMKNKEPLNLNTVKINIFNDDGENLPIEPQGLSLAVMVKK